MMTITLPEEIELRLKDEAARIGVDAETFARKILDNALAKPGPNATVALLEKWIAEETTTDPDELERQRKEGEEFMENLSKNRLEMEGPDARRLWP